MGIIFNNGSILFTPAGKIAFDKNCCCYTCEDFMRPHALPSTVTLHNPSNWTFHFNDHSQRTIAAGNYVLVGGYFGSPCMYRYYISQNPDNYWHVNLSIAKSPLRCTIDAHWGYGIGNCVNFPAADVAFPQPQHATYACICDGLGSPCGYAEYVPNIMVQT